MRLRTLAAGAQTPALSGRWEIDPARSDFGPARPPAKLTMTIEQTDTTFAFTQAVLTPGGERSARQTSRWTLSPDGKTMTLDQDVETPNGPRRLKLVFDRK